MNNEISHKDFMTILNEEKKYRELKDFMTILNEEKKYRELKEAI